MTLVIGSFAIAECRLIPREIDVTLPADVFGRIKQSLHDKMPTAEKLREGESPALSFICFSSLSRRESYLTYDSERVPNPLGEKKHLPSKEDVESSFFTAPVRDLLADGTFSVSLLTASGFIRYRHFDNTKLQ